MGEATSFGSANGPKTMVMANNSLDNPAGMGIPAPGVGCQAPVAQIMATGTSAALGSQGATGEEATGPSGNAEPLHSALPVVKSSHCACCDIFIKNKKKYSLSGNTSLFLFIQNKRQTSDSPIGVRQSDFICKKCYNSFRRNSSTVSPEIMASHSADSIHLPIYKGVASHSRCTFGCGPFESSTPSSCVSFTARMRLLVDFNLYVPPDTRCCAQHLEEQNWEELKQSLPSINVFKSLEVEDMVKNLRTEVQALRSQVLNFEFLEDIQDSLFESWIGFNKNQFLSILNSISIDCKMPSTALARNVRS